LPIISFFVKCGEELPGAIEAETVAELRQRIAVQYHLQGLSRDELDAYLAHQLKAAGVSQPLFDDTARQALYQATKGILRRVNSIALTALRLAASRKITVVDESILLDAAAEAL
jgi:type II secretory pathway predicted ATPase ExeA